jgi:hypothetical protein
LREGLRDLWIEDLQVFGHGRSGADGTGRKRGNTAQKLLHRTLR